MPSNKNKKTHQSTHSNGSTYPLPSLCSSLSSHNSSSKSLPLTKQQQHNGSDGYCGGHNGSADDESVQHQVSGQPIITNSNKQQQQPPQNRKRWDDSQFAIELCDDSYKSIRGHDKSTNSKSTTRTIKNKILKSKLFHYQQHQQHNTRQHITSSCEDTQDNNNNSPSSITSSSRSSHSSNNSQISVKFTSLLRKIKSMKSL